MVKFMNFDLEGKISSFLIYYGKFGCMLWLVSATTSVRTLIRCCSCLFLDSLLC